MAKQRWFWPRWRRRGGAAALALAAAVVALWLIDIVGSDDRPAGAHPLQEGVARGAIAALAAAVGVWAAAAVGARLARWRRGRARAGRAEGGAGPAPAGWRSRASARGRGRRWVAAWGLPVVVAAAFAVRFAGLASEVGGRYYLDEGTYYHHAMEIDGGEVLPYTFVYPHFLYYADALVLWGAARFPTAVAGAARRLSGTDDPLAAAWLLLRGVVALLSALTVLPVYGMARRLGGGGGGGGAWGGHAAALLASALLIGSGLYNEGSHLNTCDVPAAFFATVCLYFVVRLLGRESRRDYLLAGAAAGLAGAAKYPAALVVVAVAVVWVRWRLRRRDWNGGLLWAAGASVAAVVAVMPSLLAYPALAFTGSRGILFGARQYGGGGWLGVMPESNLAFYLGKLADAWGWPAAVAGLSGILLVAVLAWRSRGGESGGGGRRARRLGWRLLWLAPFPLLFLGLVTSMNMVVKRNLYPAVPILAVFLGVGMAEWLRLAAGRSAPAAGTAAGAAAAAGRGGGAAARATVPGWRRATVPGWRRAAVRWGAVALAVECLVPPGVVVARQTMGYLAPSTREEAAAWIVAHLPAGVSIVKEQYTPDLPPGRYAVTRQRFAARLTMGELRDPANDYLLLASAAYSRFADADELFNDNQRDIARRYDEIFRSFPLLEEWDPDEVQLGPVLRLYSIDPDPARCAPAALLPAAAAFVPDDAMRPDDDGPILYRAGGQWSVFHVCLPAGRYQVALLGPGGAPAGPARVRAADAGGGLLDQVEIPPAPPGAVSGAPRRGVLTVPRGGKVLLYAYLAPGSRLRAVRVSALPVATGAGR